MKCYSVSKFVRINHTVFCAIRSRIMLLLCCCSRLHKQQQRQIIITIITIVAILYRARYMNNYNTIIRRTTRITYYITNSWNHVHRIIIFNEANPLYAVPFRTPTLLPRSRSRFLTALRVRLPLTTPSTSPTVRRIASIQRRGHIANLAINPSRNNIIIIYNTAYTAVTRNNERRIHILITMLY